MLIKQFIEQKRFRVVAEIGVNGGNHAGQIIREVGQNIKMFYLVDPWRTYKELNQTDSEDRALVERDQAYWERQALKVYCMTLYCPNVRVLRLTSLQAVNVFPDEFFDFVYIDADHSYRSVIEDIKAWYPKVKRNGFLGGHDYSPGWPGVQSGVDFVFGKHTQVIDRFCWVVQMTRMRFIETREKIGGGGL